MIATASARVTLGLAARTSRPRRFRGIGKTVALVLSFGVLLGDALAAPAEFRQLGPKLFGAGSVGNAFQGISVALSADGNTIIVGGLGDNAGAGAAWVFTRRGGTWTEQGQKLVGTGGEAPTQQGYSVALSADGNTAIVGGLRDAWVFTRSGGKWTREGERLVGTGAVGDRPAYEGRAVALSADGNTALVGADADNASAGATWVFTRSGGTWTQEGSKLVGTGGSAVMGQGHAVALSADGNTALVGADADNASAGATWVFTRSGGTWTQEGSKLVGTGGSAVMGQGHAVALSADGNTALVGGYGDDSAAGGAAWVFIRKNGVWTQQGSKLVGTGNVGLALQGVSVALSADGNTALVGGHGDKSRSGAAWVFTRNAGMWTQQGSKLVGAGAEGAAMQGFSVALSADGNVALIGGAGDLAHTGAAWVFTRSNGVWTQQGAKLVGAGAVVGEAQQGISVALSASGRIAVAGRWTDNAPGGAWVFTEPAPHASAGSARHPAKGK